MSILFRRTTIFADFKNVIACMDLHVVTSIVKMVKDNGPSSYGVFKDLVSEYDEVGKEMMSIKLQYKSNMNPLLDYFNWEILSANPELNPVIFCDTLYNDAIVQESKNIVDDDYILFTNLGKSIRVLVQDGNVDALYLYMDVCPDYMRKVISIFFGCSEKIKIVTGDKEKFLKENECDSYMFENIDDVKYITRKHTQRVEVLVPEFIPNILIDEKETTPDGVILNLPSLELPPHKYLDDFNIDINMARLPI